MVLADHLAEEFYPETVRGIRLGDIGRFGVLLFFVHTSLVLMYSMQRSGLRGWPLAKNFYVRRSFRIYPLSILTVLAVLVLHPQGGVQGFSLSARPGFGEVFSNLALVQNLTGSKYAVMPLWTLPIELQMYLFLPFLFLWRGRTRWTLLGLWATSFVLGHFLSGMPDRWFSVLRFFPNFLPGIIAFTLPEKRVIPAPLWPPFILLLLAVNLRFHTRLVGAALCLLLGFAIPRFKEIAFAPLRFLSHKIATFSYGLYLGHPFFIWFALTRHHSWSLFWLMWLVIPPMLYYGVERPAIRLGTKITNWHAAVESALPSCAR
jgi:peptidoglycan/LPS O-acetylase OafA/YrhL